MKPGKKGLLSRYLYSKRVRAILPFLREGNLLEIGCGAWSLLPVLQDSKQYYGIDIEQENIESNRQLHPDGNFLVGDIEKSTEFFEQNCFDNIVMLAVIEHLTSPREVIKKLSKRLNKEGRIILTTPAPIGDIMLKAGSLIGLFDKSAEKEHHFLLDENNLKNLIAGTNLTVLKYKKFLFGMNQVIVYAINS